MKRIFKTILSLAMATTALTACTEENEEMYLQGGTPLQLTINAQTPQTKAIVEGNILPANAEIGVCLVDDSGTKYDGKEHFNVKYTTTDGHIWQSDTPIMLTGKKGTLYAYYPYSEDLVKDPLGDNLESALLTISAGDTDYMSATPVTEVSDKNPKADITLSHALAAIRLKLTKGKYKGDGVLSNITIKSLGFASNGLMQIGTGQVTEQYYDTENPTELSRSTNIAINQEEQSIDFIVVPRSGEKEIEVCVTIDGEEYSGVTSSIALQKGMIYTFPITVNDGKLEYGEYTIGGWGYEDDYTIQAEHKVTLTGDMENIAIHNKVNDDGSVTITAVTIGDRNTEEVEPVTIEGAAVLAQTFDEETAIRTITISEINEDVTVMFSGLSYWLKAVFDVPQEKSGTDIYILSTHTIFDISQIKRIKINGVEQTPILTALLDEGEHVIKYELTNDEIVPTVCFANSCTELAKIKIHAKVKTLGNAIFQYCSNLIECDFGKNSIIESMGTHVFYGCLSLASINIPKNITSVGESTFDNCSSLIDIVIPNQVTTIGGYAFENCTSLVNITIPDSVESIGQAAFYGCTALENIVFPDGVTSIGDWTFGSCSSLTSITLPDGITSIGEYAFNQCKNIEIDLIIPEGCISIGEYAFYNCKKIKSLSLPSTLKEIGLLAFGWCEGMSETVNIPKNTTTIGDGIFMTTNVSEIIVDDDNPNYMDIDNNCIVTKDGKRLVQARVNTVIPDGIEIIGLSAFQRTGITSVTIPESVTELCGSVFYGCTQLTEIYALPNEAPVFSNEEGKETFYGIANNGTLYVPYGCTEAYDSWMEVLEPLGWTIQEILQGTIDLTTASNGVYAVAQNGLGVNVEDANSTCVAVALIVNDAPTPQRLMIEKNETNNTTSIKAAYEADGATETNYTYFYWGMRGKDVSGITNYTNYGYLPKPDGTYQSTPNLSSDYTTWTSGCLSDFSGKANTAALMEVEDTDYYTTYANMATWCSKFNETPSENQGFNDWYIPSMGQLALMYLNKTAINEALTKIGGLTFASYGYWSSSESSSLYGFFVSFGSGTVYYSDKDLSCRVRVVRDI